MWQPTHVKVTVKQAKSLITKGKNGTNDVFVVIGIGKEKYQTSIKEKAGPSVEWREECELAIPSQGNKAAIQLTVYHHNSLGLDEFLGQVAPLLSDFDVYEKPKYRNYKLKGKPEKDKKKGEKERGELEVMVNFTVKSGSFLDISKKEKHKSSIASLKHIGGSLMSIGSKEKQGFKNFAKSVSSKMDKIVTKPKKKKSKMVPENSVLSNDLMTSQQKYGDADPGVISDEDDDDFRFDDDIKVYTTSSSPQSTMSRGSSLMQEQVIDADFDFGSYDDPNSSFSYSANKIPPKPPRIVIDETKEKLSTISNSDASQSFNPPGIERITSFSDPKPASGFKTIISTTELTDSTIKEESSLELKSDIEAPQYIKQNNSSIMQKTSGHPNILDVNDQQHVQPKKIKENEYFNLPATAKDTESFNLPAAYHSTFKDEIKDGANNMEPNLTTHTLIKVASNGVSEIIGPDDSFTSSYTKDGNDSAISVSNDHEQSLGSTIVSHPRSSSNTSSAVSSLYSSKDDLKMPINEIICSEKTLIKSSSAKDVTLRTGSVGNKHGKRVLSAAESWSFSDGPGSTSARASGDFSASVIRSGSLSEKRSSEPVVDEWERKLYGRTVNGSTENIDGSRSSLNSRASSTQDVRRDDSFTRLPEVKALTLERNQIAEEVDEHEVRKQKKNKGIAGFKHRLFHNKNSGGSREKLNEDSRIVEGGNDRMPLPPTRSSRLPQEIHDKFTGKSREDLLETILSLQSSLERQAKHSHDLEDYIDNLLLRVMEINPHILQAPISKKRAIKGYGPH